MVERKAFLLRVDPKLMTQIERLAQSELRSVNAQIEYLLREALERRLRPTDSERSKRRTR
ncbi:MAG TPA: hypothetical protein VNE58_15950 [Casimicrobiaceae bacterium]|nr:hypothetical protein [Casimicrobiaceae bacterium]